MSSGGVLRGRYRDGLHIGIGTDPHHDVQAHKSLDIAVLSWRLTQDFRVRQI